MAKLAVTAGIMAMACVVVFADDEASNRPVVRSSQYGGTYAKSLPDDNYGQKGKTIVYAVGRENDAKIGEYDWYANEIAIGGEGDATLIRFGPWHRGREPQADHLAIGIYRHGKVVREYSTLEMQKTGSGVSGSVSYYMVFGERIGFRWIDSSRWVYEVKGANGRILTFDLETGAIARGNATQEQAVAIATKCLAGMETREKFDLEKPVQVVEAAECWDIFFRRLDFDGKPDRGLVRVNKTTHEPAWVPLK